MADRTATRGRRLLRGVAACTALGLMIGMPASANAVPGPRTEEWWFTTWDIQNKVWPLSTGEGVTVAVLDSGVNGRLAGLANVLLPGTDTTGPHDDGHIDRDTTLGGHGTGMAALIAAQGTTDGMVGIAPGVKILPVTASVAGSDVNDVAAGIRYATDHGAKVINMSFSLMTVSATVCSQPERDAIDYAIKHDVVLVAGAGNDGAAGNPPSDPATCAGVLVAGAVDDSYAPWADTERQPYVSVAAPGVNVGSFGKAGIFSLDDGTSSSSALTSGVVALVRARFPHMSGREVVRRIIDTSTDVGQPGYDQATGYGLIRPYNAMVDHVRANSPNPVYARWDQEQRQLAASSVSPSAAPAQAKRPVAVKPAARHSSSSKWLLAISIALVVLAALVAIPLVLRRRSRNPQNAPTLPAPIHKD
jgi:subtilisin family serine protease